MQSREIKTEEKILQWKISCKLMFVKCAKQNFVFCWEMFQIWEKKFCTWRLVAAKQIGSQSVFLNTRDMHHTISKYCFLLLRVCYILAVNFSAEVHVQAFRINSLIHHGSNGPLCDCFAFVHIFVRLLWFVNIFSGNFAEWKLVKRSCP